MCVCSINLRAFSSNFGTTNIFGPKEKSLLSFSLESLKVGSLSLFESDVREVEIIGEYGLKYEFLVKLQILSGV